MITENQLKQDCTPELIKKMVELAEGFDIKFILCFDDNSESRNRLVFSDNITDGVEIYDSLFFPLLIHRAVEGWNIIISNSPYCNAIDINCEAVIYRTKNNLHDMMGAEEKEYLFKNYSPSSLTHAECAMLHCLQEVLK